jgi:hypothetical protein
MPRDELLFLILELLVFVYELLVLRFRCFTELGAAAVSAPPADRGGCDTGSSTA